MSTNQRVFVSTPQFEGFARIIERFPGELFPIQVQLEVPDEDGHSIKRVATYEINPTKPIIETTKPLLDEQLVFEF
jgi:hypothetical protein